MDMWYSAEKPAYYSKPLRLLPTGVANQLFGHVCPGSNLCCDHGDDL